jgi:cytochrome b involved in lipid metabolism
LAQRGSSGLRTKISREEIAQHDSIHDAWMIVNHKVYNVTPYLHYHPGGITILKKSLGKDATLLFDKYHPWVNIDGYVRTYSVLYYFWRGTKNITLTHSVPYSCVLYTCT